MLTIFLYCHVCAHLCERAVEVRRQLPRVSSLLPPCGIQGQDSGYQVGVSTLHQLSHPLGGGRRMLPLSLCPGLSGLTWSGAYFPLLCSDEAKTAAFLVGAGQTAEQIHASVYRLKDPVHHGREGGGGSGGLLVTLPLQQRNRERTEDGGGFRTSRLAPPQRPKF